MVRKKWLSNLKIWFKTQKEMINHLQELDKKIQDLHKHLDIKLQLIIPLIEELEPTKTYFLYIKNGSEDELQQIRTCLKLAQKQVKWTIPNILVSNIPIQEYKKRGKKTNGTRNL